MSYFRDKNMNILEACMFMRDEMKCFPYGVEGRSSGPATNSEIIRLIKTGAIEINGEQPRDFKAPMPFPIRSLIIFPKGKRRTTIYEE